MREDKNSCSAVKGVGCDVHNCKYNNTHSNCCTAEHINVQNKAAMNKAETYCGTFIPKGSM